MTAPALALAPVLIDSTGTGASTRTLEAELLDRATRDDYDQWLSGAMAAGGCVRPIRLRGTIRDIDAATGELLASPRHRGQPGQRDLPALRRPPRLGLPALRRDLPGRHLPAHPRRTRRRQRRPRIGRDSPVRVRHLHRTLLRPGPHPGRHRWREGGPLQAHGARRTTARTGGGSPAASGTKKTTPAWDGRCAPTATTTTPPWCGTPTAASCGGAPSSPSAARSTSSPSRTAPGSGSRSPRWPSSSAAA